MATATQQPKITICPPGPRRPDLETKQNLGMFHYANSVAVHAGGEWDNNAVDFSDYGRMSTMEQKLDKSRRLERPDWSVNDQRLAKVLATFMEARAGLGRRNCAAGTPLERIKRAQAAIKAQLPRKIEILDGLCKEYVELKKSPANTYKRQRELEGQIESLDTFIRQAQQDGGLGFIVGCVQTYWREGLSSVECAERLHCKPPHVRQTLFGLYKAADKIKTEVRLTMHINLLRGMKANPVAVPGKGQRQCWVCGCLFAPALHNRAAGTCSTRCKRKRAAQVEQARKEGGRMPPKYFCGPTCKDTARFAIKKLPVPVKPGVGVFVPVPNGDRYQNYVKFCLVMGTVPMTEEQWQHGN